MLGHPLQRFPCQVQPVKFRIAFFKAGEHAQRLFIMVKAAKVLHHLMQCLFPRMSEGCVSQIMRQRHRLGQIIIQPQRPRH